MAAFVRSRLKLRTLLKLQGCAGGSTARSFPRVSAPQENHNFISRRLIMQRISALLFLSVFCFATALQAQTPTPTPDPALKKMLPFLGHWTYEGESQPGPLGPGGKVTGEQNVRMILGGYFVETRTTEKNPKGETRSLEIDRYDPGDKNFPFSVYDSEGATFSGVFTVSGNTSPWSGKYVVAGKQYLIRGTDTLAADSMSFTRKSEMSADGKTWAPLSESKFTKVQPAPKK